MRPATLTTTASLSATDPAIFLQSAAGARLEAGGGGRGTRRAGGDPGAVLRRAGARVRGWLGRAHPRGHARARTPGPPRRPGRQARAVGEGRERRRRPRGRRWPRLPGRRLTSRAAFCLRVLLSLREEERCQEPHGAGPGRHLKAAGVRLGNREQGGDPAGLPRLAQLALPLGHWTVARGWGGRDGPVRTVPVRARGRARAWPALPGVRVGGAGGDGEVRGLAR